MLCPFNSALYLHVLWEDVTDCPYIVWKDAPTTCVVTVGPLVAVFFIMYRLASLEKVRMAFDTA